MRIFESIVFVTTLAGLCVAQQGVDPAYLQQYYQQVAAQAGQRAAAGAGGHEATPIFEANPEPAQHFINPGQQIRLKDQVRAQQQQPQHTQAYVAPSVREYLQQPQQQQPQQLQYVQQQQPQHIAYKQAPAKQQLLRRPQQQEYQPQGGKLNKDEPEDYDPSPSYQFGFDVKDDEFTNYQNRKEVRDGNVIKGSYSVVDSDGFIRTVKYTADPKEGFKAEVIREPTDIVVKIPTPAPPKESQQLIRHQQGPPQQYLSHQQQPQPQYQQYHQ